MLTGQSISSSGSAPLPGSEVRTDVSEATENFLKVTLISPAPSLPEPAPEG